MEINTGDVCNLLADRFDRGACFDSSGTGDTGNKRDTVFFWVL